MKHQVGLADEIGVLMGWGFQTLFRGAPSNNGMGRRLERLLAAPQRSSLTTARGEKEGFAALVKVSELIVLVAQGSGRGTKRALLRWSR